MDEQVPSQRVRAILLDSESNLILIKRIKTDQPPYWVAPGGGVESTDLSLEDALRRELSEELGARVEIERLLPELGSEHGENLISPQSFFLCRLLAIDLEKRNGPELSDPTRGYYQVEFVPLKAENLIPLNILPIPLKDFLLNLAAL
jgi:8-oxo-dGTP pyrophosphatase MutT (NUDIX family)